MASRMHVVASIEDILRIARQFPVFPCNLNKQPLTKNGFYDATQDEVQIVQWWKAHPEALVGVPTGTKTGLIVIDVDPHKCTGATTAWIQDHSAALFSTRHHDTRRDGKHYLFRSRETYASGADIWLDGEKRPGLDIRAEGGYIIWWHLHGCQAEGDIAELPPSLLVDRLRMAPPKTLQAHQRLLVSDTNWAASRARVVEALAYLDAADRDTWVKIGQAIHMASAGSDDGFNVWHWWSAGNGGPTVPASYVNERDCRYAWSSFNQRIDGKQLVTLGTLFALAYANGLERTEKVPEMPDDGRWAPFDPSVYEDMPPELTPEEWSEPLEVKEAAVATPGSSISFSDITPILDSAYLIKGVVQANSLTMMVGASGDGKSFFTIDACMAIATGQSWYGHKVNRGLVVYVAAEGGMGINNRFAAIKQKRVLSGAPIELVKAAVNLMDAAECDALVQLVRAAESKHGEKCAAIVFDTLARCMSGDENSTEDMNAAVKGADGIRTAIGCTVIVVHHYGKDASRGARGSTVLKAAVDTEISFEIRGESRVAKSTKQRDLEGGIEFAFDLETIFLGTDMEGEQVTSCVVRKLEGNDIPVPAKKPPSGATQAKLYRHLQELKQGGANGVWTTAELRKMARDLGATRTTAHDLPITLSSSGHLKNIGGAYALVDD